MPSSRFLRSLLIGTAVGLASFSCRTPADGTRQEPPATSVAGGDSATAAVEPLGALTYHGSQAAVAALDREIAGAGRDAARLSAITQRLVGTLNEANTTFAARQAIAQRLGVLLAANLQPQAAASARAALAAMLANDLQVDVARLGLDRVPGVAVDTLFLDALNKSTGRKRLALLQSIATRRIAAAVPTLKMLANDPDTRVATAALHALSQIGGTAAIEAIRGAANLDARARAQALLAAAATSSSRDAAGVYLALLQDGQLTNAQRAIATSGLLASNRAGSKARVVEILAGNDWTQKEAALETALASEPSDIVPVLADKLASFEPKTQVAVIAALQHHGHPAALRAVTAAASHPDADVRNAAIAALGFLPAEAATAHLLADIIADDANQARAARQSLARLSGTGVSQAIVAGATEGQPATRAVFIEQLALRHMPETVPQLLAMRGDPNAAVRLAAVAALGELGGAAEQQALLDWTVGARDAAEQSRALRSFVTLTLRLPDEDTRGQPLFAAIERASPEVAVQLLPALPRLGGAASAAFAARLALRDDPKIAEAAATTLARWPDRKALLPLLDVAEKAAVPARRAMAERTALQWLERNREPWTRELTTAVTRLVAGASDDQVRQRLLVILRRANDEDALALVENLRERPALTAEATETAETIRANIAGAPSFKASGSTGSLRQLIDNKPGTFWSVSTTPDQWLQIEFKAARPLHRIEMDHGERAEDLPEKFDVHVTDDLEKPGAPRISAGGQHGKTVIEFPAGTRGRYVIIKHTGERREGSWAISELFIE